MKKIGRVVAVAVLMAGCSEQRPQEQQAPVNTSAASPAFPVAPLELPAPAGASQPQLTSSSHGSILSWVEQNGAAATLRFAQRTGATWSEPRTVSSGNDWFLSDADAPMVQRLADGTLVAAW